MGFMIGLIVTVVGFILALAVHPTNPGSVNVNTVGWIMVVVGLIAFFADLVFWSSWGPGYLRRTTYVDEGPGYAPGYGASLAVGLREPPARDRGRRRRPARAGLLDPSGLRFAQVRGGWTSGCRELDVRVWVVAWRRPTNNAWLLRRQDRTSSGWERIRSSFAAGRSAPRY